MTKRPLCFVLLFAMFINIAWLSGCSPKEKILDFDDMAMILGKEGLDTNYFHDPAGEDTFVSLFSVKPKRLYVYFDDESRETLDVYVLDNNRMANAETEKISSDGKKVGSLYIAGENHFFKVRNIIVHYSGNNKSLLKVLDKTISPIQ